MQKTDEQLHKNIKMQTEPSKRAEMQTQLLPYQEDAVKWCMNHEAECCILAYDMGLGKTVIACSVLTKKPMKTMILLPNSLLQQWNAELQKHTEGFKIFLYHGAKRRRMQSDFEAADIILTTPSVVANDIRDGVHMLRSVKRWVIDEAHKLRNAKGKVYQQLHAFAPFIRNKIFLTGTPICNRVTDLISIICLSNVDHYNDQCVWKHTSTRAKIEMLDSIMPNILLRKTKDNTIQLPAIHVHEHTLNIHSYEQKNTYNRFVGDDEILRRILRMRQSLNNHRQLIETDEAKDIAVKMRKIETILHTIPSTDKVIIFSNFTSLLKHMFDTLSVDKKSMCFYHGGLDMQTKSCVLDTFRTDANAKILLINLKAGSCGLNLVEANHVIMVEPYWNDSEYQQAINRVYRIGQTKEVHVHNIFIKNSLELWLKNMQELKNKMSKMLIDSQEIEIDEIELQGEYVKRLFRCIGNVNLIERDEELHELLEQES